MSGFKGQIAIVHIPEGEKDGVDDFRNVPASDRGNDGYGDRGQLGGFSTSREPFPTPHGVTFNYDGDRLGYGVNAKDLARGYCNPGIREDPAYDKINYQDRWTLPKLPDEDQGNTNFGEQDWQFRDRNRRSRGFLTRPRLPTERG